jgi:hypothetical protein
VKIENLTSKPFSIPTGVHQGDPLLATIFNIILDLVIKKLNLRGDFSLKLKQIVAYADDVALLARSLKALKEIFHKLQNEATLVGLSINEDKTKYMQVKRTGTKDITQLNIDNFAFEKQKSVFIEINNRKLILPAGFELKQGLDTAPLTHPRRFPQEDLTTLPLELITCPSQLYSQLLY